MADAMFWILVLIGVAFLVLAARAIARREPTTVLASILVAISAGLFAANTGESEGPRVIFGVAAALLAGYFGWRAGKTEG